MGITIFGIAKLLYVQAVYQPAYLKV